MPEILAVLGGLIPDQVTAVLSTTEADPRVRAGFSVFYAPAHRGELAPSMSLANATDCRGIDHSDDCATPVLQAIFEDVTVTLG